MGCAGPQLGPPESEILLDGGDSEKHTRNSGSRVMELGKRVLLESERTEVQIPGFPRLCHLKLHGYLMSQKEDPVLFNLQKEIASASLVGMWGM